MKLIATMMLLFGISNCLTTTGAVIDKVASESTNTISTPEMRKYGNYTISTKIGYVLDCILTLGIIGYGISTGIIAGYVAGSFGGLIYWRVAGASYIYYTGERLPF